MNTKHAMNQVNQAAAIAAEAAYEPAFKPGDVVMLTAGGFEMTVESCEARAFGEIDTLITCVWHTADGQPVNSVYDHESLLNMTAIQAAIDEVLDDEEADDEYTEPTFNFTDALKHLLEGGLVKREAWTEEFLYVNVEAGEQRICVSSDDVAHTHWEATSSDILATDWQLSNKS